MTVNNRLPVLIISLITFKSVQPNYLVFRRIKITLFNLTPQSIYINKYIYK